MLMVVFATIPFFVLSVDMRWFRARSTNRWKMAAFLACDARNIYISLSLSYFFLTLPPSSTRQTRVSNSRIIPTEIYKKNHLSIKLPTTGYAISNILVFFFFLQQKLQQYLFLPWEMRCFRCEWRRKKFLYFNSVIVSIISNCLSYRHKRGLSFFIYFWNCLCVL